MKRCARCHQPYEDEYDGCPYCAAAEMAQATPEKAHATGAPGAAASPSGPPVAKKSLVLWILTAGLPFGAMMFLITGMLNRSFTVARAVLYLVAGVLFGVAMWAVNEYRSRKSGQG